VKKIHLLGSTGFIGSNLLKDLSALEEYKVAGYSSMDCNLLSYNSIEKALPEVEKDDVMIMTSAITRLKDNSFDCCEKNILMAKNLSAFLEKYPISRLIFFSTVDVYGLLTDEIEIDENTLPNPNDYYALSKITSEYLLGKTCFNANIPMTVLRLSGIYGPGDEGKSTINKLLLSAMNGKITIYGDGSNKRDFLYVEDISRIVKLILKNEQNGVFNIATGKSSSLIEIVKILSSLFKDKFIVEHKPEGNPAAKRVSNMSYDISLLNKTFPEFKFIDLRKGLSMYLNRGGSNNG